MRAAYISEVQGLLHELIRLYHEADQEEKACCGLTISQCCTLLAFDSADEQLTMNTLSERVGLSTSTMTRHVDGLVNKGHLVRMPSVTDRRQVIVQLTQTGKAMTEKLSACETTLVGQVLQAIPEAEWERVVTALKSLVGALKTRAQNCC